MNCFRRPFPDVIFNKGLNELVSPLRTFDIQSALLERPQRWELPELREGWKAIKLGVIEFSVQPLDLVIASCAGVLDFHDFTMAFDPREICFYHGPKELEVYEYGSTSPLLGTIFRSPSAVIFPKSRSFSRRSCTTVGVS